MRKIDLRELGTIIGLPVYIDLASVRVQSERVKKELLARDILRKLLESKKDDDGKTV